MSVSAAPDVDRAAPLQARLLGLVRSIAEGEALPAERQLAAEFGVARMTLRRAVDHLVADGLLVREQGRGTFVTRPRLARQLAMTSFTEEMRNRGLLPSSEVLDLRRMRASEAQANRLRIPANDPIFRFRRVRLADGEPIGFETMFTPADLVHDLSASDLAGSWYELLENRYRLRIARGTSVIEPVLLTAREASLLRTTVRRPAFRIETSSYLENGRVIEQGTSLFRGDRYRLAVELKPLPVPRPRACPV